jgi:hypothetical protein
LVSTYSPPAVRQTCYAGPDFGRKHLEQMGLAVVAYANVVFCQLAPWEFEYQKCFNQKRTFRRVSCLLTRILGNMGVDEPTPMLARFSSPVQGTAGEGRWRAGLYLDQPQESDDPYRYFQW